ncbi:MAG: DUF1134 domain-containing protein [Gammaproteobacteria bacterium]|nr:DUF1134 domain-containing protein [Gammaproteobacteria bacterium]
MKQHLQLSLAAVAIAVCGATSAFGAAAPTSGASAGTQGKGQPVSDQQYTAKEILIAAGNFFGSTSGGLAKVIEKAFADNGRPNAYITGNEGSGAFIVGLRYGAGWLSYKGGGQTRVYWNGPSAGFDFGGNASKAFILVYNLHWTNDLYQRFPGVDGSLYFVAGLGLNYVRANNITMAPIRTGVGLRYGADVGYLKFTPTRSYIPF